jgi:hypothetical protein
VWVQATAFLKAVCPATLSGPAAATRSDRVTIVAGDNALCSLKLGTISKRANGGPGSASTPVRKPIMPPFLVPSARQGVGGLESG